MLDLISTLALTLSGGTLLANLATFRTPKGDVPTPAPKGSILVPARNEALNIHACVTSLLAQTYPNMEIVVLDDQSEDGTGAILQTLLDKTTSRLRVIQGKPLPDGWTGKNWACHQLAQAADPTSDYLLFTDADTVHDPSALSVTVAEAEGDGLALLSLFPEQQVETWAEPLIVPLFGLQILGFLPLMAMERHPHPALAAANGQYLLFRHTAYRAIGGHAAIADEIAEDVSLARLCKAQGQIRLANGAGLVRCRMYRNLPEILRGFRRSFSSGFRIDPLVFWVIVVVNVLAYLLPFLRFPVSKVARRLVVAILLLRTLLAWRTRTPFRSVVGHPVGMAFMLYTQFAAAYDARVGRSTAWKGRRYTL